MEPNVILTSNPLERNYFYQEWFMRENFKKYSKDLGVVWWENICHNSSNVARRRNRINLNLDV